MRTAALSLTMTGLITIISSVSNTLWAEIPWQENLRSAHTKAQAEGKNLLLHFYSDNCVYCDRLEAGAFRSPDVSNAISQSYVPVKIHANENPKLTTMFKVTKFPTDVIVTTKGKTLSHNVSPQAAGQYVAMLQSAIPAEGPGSIAAIASAAKQPALVPSYATPTAEAQVQLPQASQPVVASDGKRINQFAMPADIQAGTDARLTSASKSTAISELNTAATLPTATDTASVETSTASEPELAMQGYCPVTVINDDRWVEGNPKFGVVHLGKLYLFADELAMKSFLADPVSFTPVLNEIDVVRFFEERRIVPGKREWGLKDPKHNRMFFFADEAAMNHFWNDYDRYVDAAIEVMDKAVKEANPGT